MANNTYYRASFPKKDEPGLIFISVLDHAEYDDILKLVRMFFDARSKEMERKAKVNDFLQELSKGGKK